MTGLYDAPLGAGAIVRQTRRGLLRRVRHGDASFMVDSPDEVGLVLNLSASHRVERWMAGRVRSDMPHVGSVSVLPPGCPARFAITGACRVLQLRLPWPVLAGDAASSASSRHVELQPSLNADDPALARLLIAAAVTEAEGVDAALQDIATHLVEWHAAGGTASSTRLDMGGISPVRLRRVLQRIEADLLGTVPLKLLAAEAGMSPAHFAREFARKTGLPPHRYVVRRRVERAVQLLGHAQLSVAEVARKAGFTHASHLARHMRHQTGVTPALLRSHVLP